MSGVEIMNYKGSSGSMEKEGAVEMFLRSIDKYNLKYAEYIGDGDSNSFGAVKQELENMVTNIKLRKKTVSATLKKEWVLHFVHIRISARVLFYQMVRLLVVLRG